MRKPEYTTTVGYTCAGHVALYTTVLVAVYTTRCSAHWESGEATNAQGAQHRAVAHTNGTQNENLHSDSHVCCNTDPHVCCNTDTGSGRKMQKKYFSFCCQATGLSWISVDPEVKVLRSGLRAFVVVYFRVMIRFKWWVLCFSSCLGRSRSIEFHLLCTVTHGPFFWRTHSSGDSPHTILFCPAPPVQVSSRAVTRIKE